MPPASAGALTIALAHDCACCNGKLILQTHLSRTLRMRRPDRLFVEAVLDSHLPATLQWLGGPQWAGWFEHVRCMALLPLVKPFPDSRSQALPQALDGVTRQSGVRTADRVPFQRTPNRSRRPPSGVAAEPSGGVGATPDVLTDLEQLALSQADVVCFDRSGATAALDPSQAAERLLRARAIGGSDQWRMQSACAQIEWDVVEPALAMARRPL